MAKKQGVVYQKDGKNYFSVKRAIRRGRQVVEDRVFIELEAFNNRIYRFTISPEQLRQLLLGGKNGKK